MENDIELTVKRLIELSDRASKTYSYTHSEFLTMAEQSALSQLSAKVTVSPYALHGGFLTAERKIALFGSADMCGYETEPPISCVFAAPKSARYADALSHRDFLGALMSLGVRRSVLGDIVVSDNCGYIVCLTSIADFLAGELKQIRRTSVAARVLEGFPDLLSAPPQESSINIASERLDSIIAAVYKLSRSESGALIGGGLVYIDSVVCEKGDRVPTEGAIVSVRGHGRFIYSGISGSSRKGRLYADVKIFM